jgi:Ca2+-binding EF-hand superfamily protein
MGNILESESSSYFLSEVSKTFTILTKCKLYEGKSKDILLLQQKVAKVDLLHSCFVDPSQMKSLFKKTPIEGCEVIVVNNFLQRTTNKINIMEVLAAIVTYAAETLEEKVQLAVDIFDFDENHVITYDEMLVLCKSFINGIGIMTNSALYSKATLEALGDQAFIMADATPDGRITYEE